MSALEKLEEWARKYYKATILVGPSIQPGDEGVVRLAGGGRVVMVDPYDCPGRAPDELPTVTISDMILEALRRWDADPTPKLFEVMVSTAAPVLAPRPEAIRWSSNTYFRVDVVAANDEAAIAAALALFDPGDGARVTSRKYVHERGPAKEWLCSSSSPSPA